VVTSLNQMPILSGIWQVLVVRMDTIKTSIKICYDEIGLCAQSITTILGLIANTIGRVYMIT
jgi:hypothetical protein